MEEVKVAAVELGRDRDTSRIIDEMLSGCRSAGARTRHLVLSGEAETAAPDDPAELEAVATGGDLSSSVDILAASDHVIIGRSALCGSDGDAGGRFRDECYGKARWTSLADVIAEYGDRVRISPGANPADFRFPVPRRELSGAHRGLVVLRPPSRAGDHDDPFSEDAFFVLEELVRILGFMPQGRILATGLYYPPVEENPVLKEQAFDLGRRLVAGSVIAREGRA